MAYFSIKSNRTGITIAEYERDEAVAPSIIDAEYIGDDYVTYDANGFVVDTANLRTSVREIPKLDFLRRLTPEERMEARRLSRSSHPQALVIEDFMELLNATVIVSLDNADVLAGLTLLSQVGALSTPERINEILR